MAFRYAPVALSALFALTSFVVSAQVPERLVGTVASIVLDRAAIEVKGQDGALVTVMLTSDTVLQRVAPGEKSLKNAETIQISDIAIGDKVLVNSDPATASARRLIVMSATAIAKHDESDRMAWTTHGVSGIVVAKTGEDLTLRLRTMQGETQAHVLVSNATTFRKYAADSVRFGDAKPSNLAEVEVGDQLRARGDKSEDGLKVTAAQIVFGTFVTKAGTITAIDSEHKSIAVKELNTSTAFNVKLTPDSQLKQMPNFPTMAGGGMPGGGPPNGGPPSGGPPNGGPPMMGGRPPDIAQMVERMPTVSLDSLKVGDTVVMSSTKGAVDNEYTAIVLLDNAEMLIRLATSQPGGQTGRAGGSPAAGMQGVVGAGGGLGNLELPGIMQ